MLFEIASYKACFFIPYFVAAYLYIVLLGFFLISSIE